MPQKAILVVSDLHCGSIFGLLPPGFATSDGAPKSQNAGQKHLWNCWMHLAAAVADKPIVAVVVNGDAVDGRQDAQKGVELALPIPTDQTAAAVDVLRALVSRIKSKPQVMIVQGTEYHDQKGGTAAEAVAAAIGARAYNGLGTGRYCREVLDLDIGGVVLNFMHGTSVAGGLYRATPPDREAVWSALAGKDGKSPKADAVIRAHAHHFVHVEHASKHAVIGPCWQLQTRFMRKNSAYRMIPDIGALLIWVDPEAKKAGEDPITVRKILYPLPAVPLTHL